MSAPFAQLNLRPQERRILVIVALLIFVVLNFWLVTPLVGQLAQAEGQLEKARATQRKYEGEIARAPSFEKIEDRLKSQGGEILSQELQLARIVSDQAIAAGVSISRSVPGVRNAVGRTNQFFEDQGLTIDFTTGGKELVEFLVGLASGNSMVHVQDMNLRRDSSGTKLVGSAVFVASYQKKQSTARVESGSQPRAAGSKTNAPAAPPQTGAARTNAAKVQTNSAAVKTPAAPAHKISTNSAQPKK
jgi:Tfp pilus assembly protein PilO